MLATVTPPATSPVVLRTNANRPSGVAVDGQGRILVCEGGTRALARVDGATRTPLVENYMGQQLNGPMDVPGLWLVRTRWYSRRAAGTPGNTSMYVWTL